MAVINLATFVSSIPIATRSLTAALLAFSLLIAVLRISFTPDGIHIIRFSKDDSSVAFPWLVIVPGSSFYYPWTLLTAAFCETSFFEFIISIVSLPLAGRYLERIWGPTELLRFSAVVIITSNVIAWFLALVLFGITRGEKQMYGIQYHGLEALQTGFLVAFAQLIPEHQIQLKGLLKVRVRDLPMAYVTFSNIVCILGYPSPFILIQFGWLVGWAYLRFFKVNEGGIRGDRSETFSLVSWFPPFMHRPVTFISNTLYGIFVRVGVIEPWHYSALGDVELGVGSGLPSMNVGIPGMSSMAGATSISNPGQAATSGGGGLGGAGSTRAEAERRRAMALKALDQRVKAGSQVQANGRRSSMNGTAPRSSDVGPGGSMPNTAKSPSFPAAVALHDDTKQSNNKAGVPRVVVQDTSRGEKGGDDNTGAEGGPMSPR